MFLAVCYDSFGIKHQKLRKRGVDLVFDLIHGFYPKGEGGSGEVYFAKHGLAGAAKQWNCPVFGAVVFLIDQFLLIGHQELFGIREHFLLKNGNI